MYVYLSIGKIWKGCNNLDRPCWEFSGAYGSTKSSHTCTCPLLTALLPRHKLWGNIISRQKIFSINRSNIIKSRLTFFITQTIVYMFLINSLESMISSPLGFTCISSYWNMIRYLKQLVLGESLISRLYTEKKNMMHLPFMLFYLDYK